MLLIVQTGTIIAEHEHASLADYHRFCSLKGRGEAFHIRRHRAAREADVNGRIGLSRAINRRRRASRRGRMSPRHRAEIGARPTSGPHHGERVAVRPDPPSGILAEHQILVHDVDDTSIVPWATRSLAVANG
jgi:hypothetical protein